MLLRQVILHNFWLKLFSLMLATLVWFAVAFGMQSGLRVVTNPITNPIQREKLRLPISVLTQPADARVFRVLPEFVDVTVEGEAAVLRDFLRKEDIAAYVDLNVIRHNEKSAQRIRVHVPDGVVVIDVTPQTTLVEQISP